jgi:hypothetical protein
LRLVNIQPVRNEAWCLGLTARALLRWCDDAVFLLHACTDASESILEAVAGEYPGRVHVIHEAETIWREMHHRQRLLEYARCLDATHISVVDADEIIAGDTLPTMRDHVAQLSPKRFTAIKFRNIIDGLDQYRAERGPWGTDAGTIVAFGDHPHLCWEARNGYDHHQRSPYGASQAGYINGGGLLHLQFASRRRLIAKHALYKASERVKYPNKSIRDIDALYNMAPSLGGITRRPTPAEWWAPYTNLMHHCDIDAEPWQEKATRDLVSEYGAAYFNGLDLFGVAQ